MNRQREMKESKKGKKENPLFITHLNPWDEQGQRDPTLKTL